MQRLLYYCIFFFLVACSEQTSDKQVRENAVGLKKDAVQIDWMSTWTYRKSKRTLVENAARDFELLNQEVRVNLKFSEEIWPNFDKNRQPLIHIHEMIQTGKTDWDIVNLDKFIYNALKDSFKDERWPLKYLVNFEEFDWFRESHKDAIINDKKFRESWGGMLPGPMIEGYYHGLWYNKAVADQIGLKIKPFGMTFDDLLGYFQKAYEYNKTASQKVNILSEVTPSKTKTDLFNSLVISALGDADTAKVSINQSLAALKRTLIAFEKLSQYHPLEVFTEVNPDIDPVLDGKTLFGIFPSTFYNIMEATDKEKLKNMYPAELPVFEKPGMFYIGSYQSVWAVFKNAPHREEAIQLIKYLCSRDVAERWVSSTKNPTALKLRIDATDFNQDEIDRFNNEIGRKYEGKLAIYDISKVLFGSKSKVKIDGLPVLRGRVSAEEYYNEIVRQVR
jgi:ABC-type glycerol-3-phosphate transport system substrate-binding protein